MNLIENIASSLGDSVRKVEEEVLKELLSCCSQFKPDEINADNVVQIKQKMEQHGYRIEHTVVDGDSIYELYQGEKRQIGVKLSTQIDFAEGKAKMTIKRNILK